MSDVATRLPRGEAWQNKDLIISLIACAAVLPFAILLLVY